MLMPFDSADFSSDVDFESDPGKGNDRDAWYKLTKGVIDLGSFVYFHPVHHAAVAAALRADPRLTREDQERVARKALADHAAKLGKPVDQLLAHETLDLSTIKFKKVVAHYQEGLGYVISRLGKDGRDGDAIWKQIAEPKVYYTTVIIQYPADRKGNVSRDPETFKTGWAVRPWRLSTTNYDEFQKLSQSLKVDNINLAGRDIKFECTDQKFQSVKPVNAGPSIWMKSDKFRAEVLTKAIEDWYDKLVPFREMTTNQLREKLGGGGSSNSGQSAGSMSSGESNGGSLPAAGGGSFDNHDDILSSV